MSQTAHSQALRVVAIGGGTGLSTLLRGLKRFVSPPPGAPTPQDSRCKDAPCVIHDLSAIVTVTDDGGSSGRLRDELNMLPPGDVRNCLVALSEDEHLLSRLFQHRFQHGDLGGHSFGNLFLAALTEISGDFAQAVQTSSQILATRGRIYPSTTVNARLSAIMDDGSIVRGETNITQSKRSISELLLEPSNAAPMPEALEAIEQADLITIGPGSLYTSLITNLLVRGIPEAMASTNATRVYACNLMTQANESLGLSASQHIEKIFNHAHGRIFDYALINTAPILPATLEQYAREGQTPIEADLERIRALGVEPIVGNFVHEGNVLRHNYDNVAEVVLAIGQRGRIA
ncbi:gluconeogenesis factor YvcK family protein [Granulicella cerasi]|uniref:gluconeogenesis factor YvcK family protein n=1 Tax=Granulicella cerasi TaxID=741063 RepID=UPI0021E0FB91|nr:uridine diphosphate-N-acetylglucosamine-binding protein YvcK [Granulicella cerasi]